MKKGSCHSRDALLRMSEAHRGYKPSVEAIQKRVESLKQYYVDHPEAIQKRVESLKQYYVDHPEARQRKSEWRKGYLEDHPDVKRRFLSFQSAGWNKGKKGIHSVDTLRRLSEKGREYFLNHPEAKQRFLQYRSLAAERCRGRHLSPEHIAKLRGKSSWSKGKRLSEEHRKNLSEAQRRRFQRPLEREKITRALMGRKQSNELIQKRCRSMLRTRDLRRSLNLPNAAEKKLGDLLQRYYPNQWKYTGNGEVWVGKYNPDFWNVNGLKACIEMYGDHWHRNDNPQERVHYFASYGFNCLIVWERELKDPDGVIVRVRDLMERIVGGT